MLSNLKRKNCTNWLIVALLSASSRILETLAMILPIKAIFVLMKPDVVPSFWFEQRLDLADLMVFIVVLVVLLLLLGKILHVIAKRKAKDLHHSYKNDEAEEMALVTTKITSSIIVMIIFACITGYVNFYALLLTGVLFLVSQIRVPLLKGKAKSKFYSLLGISKEEARIRFISQILFLVYFMSLLVLTIQQEMEVTITLLLIMLIGRRNFGEFSRLRIGLFNKKQIVSGAWADAKNK